MEILNEDKTRLNILENFITDTKLPKHSSSEVSKISGNNDIVGGGTTWTVSGVQSGFISIDGQVVLAPKKSLFSRLFPPMNFERRTRRYSVEEFFKSLKNSCAELKRIDERIESFGAVLKQAQDFGQVALIEKIQDELDVIKSETQLYAIKLTTVITEAQVVKFAKDTEKGLS